MISSRYHVIKLLREGGNSKVYLGNDRLNGDNVVIKSIPFDENIKGKIISEVNILKYIKGDDAKYLSRNFVISYKDSLIDEKHCHLIMEYTPDFISMYDYIVNNPSISSLINSGDTKSALKILNDRISIICNLLRGLDFIHSTNIVHFDIKPDNVLVNFKDLRTKYIDFGHSCFKESCNRYILCGTPGYSAPEVDHYMAEYKYDFESYKLTDLWSLGITIFQLLTSREYTRKIDEKRVNIGSKMDKVLYNFILKNKPIVLELLTHLLSVDPHYRYVIPNFIERCTTTTRESTIVSYSTRDLNITFPSMPVATTDLDIIQVVYNMLYIANV